MILLGITGTDGAGKGEVVSYLVSRYDFSHFSARALFIDEINRLGLTVNRENMRLVANELRKTQGNDYFAKESIHRAKVTNTARAVLESFRAFAEVETLKEEGGYLLAVDADQKLRFERIQKRASESDAVNFETFQNHEELEMNDPDPNGMQKRKVMDAADITIQNNGTLPELHAQIDDALKQFGIA